MNCQNNQIVEPLTVGPHRLDPFTHHCAHHGNVELADTENQALADHLVKIASQVQNPAHYNKGIECADYIESHEMDFFQGNAIKYLTRFKLKGTPIADLHKAKWYIERLIEIETKRLANEHNKSDKNFSGQVNK